MNERPTPRSLVVDLGVLLVSEVLGYIAFLVNVPFALSLVLTIAFIVIVLQYVYGLYPLRLLAWTGIPAEGHFHAELKDFLRFYAIAAFVLFVTREIVRAVFRLKRPTFRRRLVTPIIVLTLAWAFVIAHVPLMRVAPGTTRVALAMMFFFVYLVGLGGFVVGSVIAHASDALIDRFVTLDKTPSAT